MLCRFYHTTNALYHVNIKQALKLSKMINSNKKNKSVYYDVLPTTKSLAHTSKEPGKQAIRRVSVLNKLFMKYITDIMTTGNLSINILGRGIEISKVKISSDYQMLNVYWLCKGTLKDVQTEQILNSTAGPLRHELSTLRLMGEVPYITFVKDTQEAKLYDLDQRLCKADYGEDYVPTEIGHILKTEFSLDTKLSPEMKAKIKQIEEEFPTEETPLPEMSNNIYGIDHSKILNRLIAARKKSQDAWRRVSDDNSIISYRTTDPQSINIQTPPSIDTVSQKKELSEFLIKRQALQNKLYKEMMSSKKEREMAFENKTTTANQEDNLYEYFDDDDDEFDDEVYNDGEPYPRNRLEDLINEKDVR